MCPWEQYFGSDDYFLLEGGPPEWVAERSADFTCSALDIGSGSRVLDVGCGTGRIALALIKRGCLVTGVDSSAYMVSRCRGLALHEPKFTVCKMYFGEMAFEEEFDAVVCWSHSLGCGTREDDAEAVRRMVASLVPGGAILIDLHNLARYRKKGLGRSWQETDAGFLLEDMAYDETEQKLLRRDIIVPKDGGRPREFKMTMLEYQPSDITGLLESVGVGEIIFYGDARASKRGPLFSREGFSERSNCMIVTGRKGDG